MKQLTLKLALFSVPFLVWGLVVSAVDPFNLLGISPLVEDGIKQRVSYRLHYAMWKVLEYNRRPQANILLGDSRTDHIDTGYVEEVTGERYYNFAYGGGTLPEIVDTFWYAASKTRLKNVYIGMSFNLFNAVNSMNRFPEAQGIVANPARYFINKTVLRAVGGTLYAQFVDRRFKVGEPPQNHDVFWNHQLTVTADYYFKSYRYGGQYRDELKKIADYCRERGIRLVFVMYPTHTDLQKRMGAYRLTELQRRFRSDVRSLGVCTIDLDTPNRLTEQRENFIDPFHFNADFMRRIVKMVWSEKGSALCGGAAVDWDRETETRPQKKERTEARPLRIVDRSR